MVNRMLTSSLKETLLLRDDLERNGGQSFASCEHGLSLICHKDGSNETCGAGPRGDSRFCGDFFAAM